MRNKHIKSYLHEHEVITVREMKWGGIKNGKFADFVR